MGLHNLLQEATNLVDDPYVDLQAYTREANKLEEFRRDEARREEATRKANRLEELRREAEAAANARHKQRERDEAHSAPDAKRARQRDAQGTADAAVQGAANALQGNLSIKSESELQ